MEKDVIINNHACWKIMVRIVVCKLKNEITFTELANRLELSITHPYLNTVKKFLIQEGIMVLTEQTKREIFYKINIRELAFLLRESQIFEFNSYVIKETNYAYNI